MNIKVLLGKRIREIRLMHNYTQAQLAELLEIDDKHLSRIELGKNMPNPVVLEKISSVFNMEIKDLFEFSHLNSPIEVRELLFSTIKDLSDEQVVQTYKFVRSFVI